VSTARVVLGRCGLLLVIWAGLGVAGAHAARIVVYGASGAIGGVIVQEALNRGDTVIGVARNVSKMTITDPRFSAQVGDVTDLDSFKTLTQGADAAIISVTGNGRDNAPENSTQARAAQVAVSAFTGMAHSPQCYPDRQHGNALQDA